MQVCNSTWLFGKAVILCPMDWWGFFLIIFTICFMDCVSVHMVLLSFSCGHVCQLCVVAFEHCDSYQGV